MKVSTLIKIEVPKKAIKSQDASQPEIDYIKITVK